jgi:hypothetical protein
MLPDDLLPLVFFDHLQWQIERREVAYHIDRMRYLACGVRQRLPLFLGEEPSEVVLTRSKCVRQRDQQFAALSQRAC